MSCQNRNFRVFSEEKSYIAGLSSPCSFLLTRLTFSEGAELVAYGAKGLVLWQQSIICNSAFHVHHHLLLLRKKKKTGHGSVTTAQTNRDRPSYLRLHQSGQMLTMLYNQTSFLFFYFNWFFLSFMYLHQKSAELFERLHQALISDFPDDKHVDWRFIPGEPLAGWVLNVPVQTRTQTLSARE